MTRIYLLIVILLMGFAYAQHQQWLGFGVLGSNNQLLALWLLILFLSLPWHIHRVIKKDQKKNMRT